MARNTIPMGSEASPTGLPPNFGPTSLAPGALARLTAKNKARLLKRTPRGLIATAPLHAMRGAGTNTVLD